METSPELTEQSLSGLISSQVDFPAKMFPAQASSEEYMVPDQGYTSKCCKSWGWLDRDLLLWKTWQLCLVTGWATFSQTWPLAGLMRNGQSFQHPCSALRTGATAYSWLPTPLASGWMSDRLSIQSLIKRGEKHDWGNLAEWMAQRHAAKPSPTFVEMMMGFPIGWTELPRETLEATALKDSATPSCLKLPNGSGGE